MNKSLHIAIAGLGTVGSSVIEILENQRDIFAKRAGRELKIVAVSARNSKKIRAVDLSNYRFEPDPLAFAAAKDIDLVVELIGGAEGAALSLAQATLSAGKHLVTANKALIATHAAFLSNIAESQKKALMFEAAVAGGIPVIKLLREGLAANNISRVVGILNGTCNYILTHMWENKTSFAEALAEAKKLGYAEADPSFDIDGIDAGHKLAILAGISYGFFPDISALQIRGISEVTLRDMQFADELGYVIRLLAVSQKGGAQQVYPALVAKNSNLASVCDVFNAVQIDCDQAGTIFIKGRGAGGQPTASAVIADIIDVARGNYGYSFSNNKNNNLNKNQFISENKENKDKSEYYIRFAVIDKSGVLADITSIFRDLGISLKSFIQHGSSSGENVYIVIATHQTSEEEIKTCLAAINNRPSIVEKPVYFRMLE